MKKQMLNGIDEISRFCEKSNVTLLDWKRDFNFPMHKDKGGASWQADPVEIMAWFKERKCSPQNVSTEKLERYDFLQKTAAGKGRKYKRQLVGLHAISEFIGVDSATAYDFMKFWVDCPIKKGADLQPTVDADELAAWAANIEIKTGKAPA